MRLATGPRAVAALAVTALAVLGIGAPGAAALPQSVKSLDVRWANAQPATSPFGYGTLTIGGTYTCTAPTGTTVPVHFTSFQIIPLALPSGSGTLPCGPAVVDAPWELTSYPNPEVHHGYTSLLVTFDGVDLPAEEFTA
ncbi:hypothetical protein [Streptomyces uncialis]|uniref:Ig-like domain-containing protein n=1 Tax=Streptomyces uncialis TaxID=1048205 RepID=A0A1Q4VA00_9ACTN|nr:hypothetical protein [Streptomyces uncialis]OKH94671.1 hypothetical protein AB852_10670 [Streptomyces uncialis]